MTFRSAPRITTIVLCAHCHEPRAGTQEVQIFLVGVRTLCGTCRARLDAMGYDIRMVATPSK